jgi:hypothetical protein
MLKGIAYAGTIYPDPAERPMNDIDLLVPVGQLPDAMRSMADIGFVRGGAPRNLSSYYHEVFFSRGDMLVELHRSIVQRGRTRIPLDEIWQRAALDPRAHGALRLDPVDDFLFCVLHIARSELAVPVLNYVDVARLWPRLDPASRAQFHDRAHDFRVARAVAAVLSMTDLLRTGNPGRPAVPGGRLLPASDDILLASRPRRLPQITQKLVLTEGPREVLGLGFAYARSTFDGWWRRR